MLGYLAILRALTAGQTLKLGDNLDAFSRLNSKLASRLT